MNLENELIRMKNEALKHENIPCIALLMATNNAIEIALNCKTLNIEKTSKPSLNINVYPVPATNEINVEFNSSKKTDYKIYNVFGQQLKNGIITAYEKINIESLSHGIYYLKVGQTTIRFIKE